MVGDARVWRRAFQALPGSLECSAVGHEENNAMSEGTEAYLDDDERRQLVADLREVAQFLKAQGLERLAKQVSHTATHIAKTGKIHRPWAPTSGTMAD